jgi:hypothetical protein
MNSLRLISVVTIIFTSACSQNILNSRPVSSSLGIQNTSGGYYYLPIGKIKIDVIGNNDDYYLLVEFGNQPIMEQDSNHLYLIDYDESWFSYDQIKVEISNGGFIEKVSITAEDKTDEIIVELAKAAIKGVKAGAASFIKTDKRQEANEIILFSNTIDPTSPTDINQLNNILFREYYKLKNKLLSEILDENIKLFNKIKLYSSKKNVTSSRINSLTQNINFILNKVYNTQKSTLETEIKELEKPDDSASNKTRDLHKQALLKLEILKIERGKDNIASELKALKNALPKNKTDFETEVGVSTDRITLLNDKLKSLKKIKVTVTPNSNQLQNLNTPQIVIAPCVIGICYRPLMPFSVKVVDVLTNTAINQITLALPNKSPVLSIDLNRARFVQKITNLKFNDGVLTEVDIKKPSEALSLVSIPLDILTEVAKLPAELIQLKFNISTESEKLYKARINELNTRAKLLEKEKEIIEKKE